MYYDRDAYRKEYEHASPTDHERVVGGTRGFFFGGIGVFVFL
jgi:hypothetical protein